MVLTLLFTSCVSVCVCWMCVCVGAVPAASGSLFTELESTVFYASGQALASDEYVDVNMEVSYNEPDNVTCTGCQWSVGNGRWTYPWLKDPSPAPHSACNTTTVSQNGNDMPGADLSQSSAPPSSDACGAVCCSVAGCRAFVFEAQTDSSIGGCIKGGPCCFLKSAQGKLAPKTIAGGIVVGAVLGGEPAVVAPPLGIRSAPPLGGVSAGSVELRADGSFRDWTILNQGPTGSGKYGLVDEVVMAAKFGSKSRVLRTHPPAALAGKGVSSLTFSGTYPVTRLVLDPSDFKGTAEGAGGGMPAAASVYGFSTLRPTDLEGSAAPQITLTLAASNPTGEAMNVSFMFALPMAAMTDCQRHGDGKGGDGSIVRTYQGCLHACHASPSCASWEYDDDGAGTCRLNADVPLTAHAPGPGRMHCGVRSGAGGWAVDAAGESVTLDLFGSTAAAGGPSIGDVTLRPVVEDGRGGSGGGGGASGVSFAAGDDLAALFRDFSGEGPPPPPPAAAAPAASSAASSAASPAASAKDGSAVLLAATNAPRVAAFGAATAWATLAPGANATLSVVFAWHFPNRDFDGQNLGNAYVRP